MRSAVLSLVLASFALLATADAEAAQRRLEVNKLVEGVYDFCLSFEDARVKQESLAKAISRGMSLAAYGKQRPKLRCYSNSIKFIPRRLEPRLDGIDYVYKQDPQGRLRCPKGMPRGSKCTIDTRDVRYIEATIIYSGNQFPIFVRMTDHVLVGADGQVVSQ